MVGSKNRVHAASAAVRSRFQIAILRMKIAMLRLHLDVHHLDWYVLQVHGKCADSASVLINADVQQFHQIHQL